MKKSLILSIILLLITLPLPAAETSAPRPDKLETAALEFINFMVKEDFSAATRNFDEKMLQALPPDRLGKTWAAIINRFGQYRKHLSARQEKIQQYDVVILTSEFELITLDIQVAFDRAGKIAGLYFRPSQKPAAYEPPAYVKPGAYLEKEITIGTGQWSLPGTLTVPQGQGPFPALVLVHGSGPQDRDETIGPNKPFRDLAWGLASQGIAVLRYEKRTRQHAEAMIPLKNEITVNEETVADAAAAVALLSNTPGIDKKGIFVLGHSLGGMLIPRIAPNTEQASGYIIMAGATRPLEDLIYDQVRYVFALDNHLTEDERTQLEQLAGQVRLVKSNKLSPDTPSESLPLTIPAGYWLDLKSYKPAHEASRIKKRLLILRGERDYQVTEEDYQGWQEALTKKNNVDFRLYPTLNHLFMPGQGKGNPSEYDRPGHVSETVVNDIAEWIKKR